MVVALLIMTVEGEMYLYLAISPIVVSLVLVQEEDEQKPVYYISKVLKDMESR